MKLGYELTIEQTQKLVMTPELIQAIQILQFNTQELDNYVQEQILINPVLEPVGANGIADSEHTHSEENTHSDDLSHGESIPADNRESDIDWREQIKERGYDDISYRQWEYNRDEKDYSYEQFVTSDVTLPEHLMFQLQFAPIKKGCRAVGRYIIESLDENGYMTLPIEEIARATGVSQETVEKVMEVVQSFEPAGVGARNLQECLIIQLRNTNRLNDTIEHVINEHLNDIAGNRLNVIAKDLSVNVREIQEISDIIRTLEPKPGRQFASQTDTRYITPDVIVERVDDEYIVTVNESSTPRLMVSSYYERLMNENQNDDNLSKYLSGRINSAIWLIKSIEQRKQTIYNVVKAVVKYQKDFFDNGEKYLKTLTLKQIAEDVGIHESTVSRSINGKYMQSPRGMFEIKFFFTSGVPDSQGEGISSKSVKSFIKEIVDGENPQAPYSDQDMVQLLADRGIDISRRTVAKYRDEMNILSSSKRKRY